MKTNTKSAMAVQLIARYVLNTYGYNYIYEHTFDQITNRKFRSDIFFPVPNLAVEIEGGIFTNGAHGSITGILRDIEKQNVYTINKIYLLRFTYEDIKTGNCFKYLDHFLREKTK